MGTLIRDTIYASRVLCVFARNEEVNFYDHPFVSRKDAKNRKDAKRQKKRE